MKHISYIVGSLLFGLLVSWDANCGMGALIAGENHIMIVNKEIHLLREDNTPDVYRTRWGQDDTLCIVKITNVRKLDGHEIVLNAMIDPEKYRRYENAGRQEAQDIRVEIVPPGTTLMFMNADDYHSSLPDGSQVFIRVMY